MSDIGESTEMATDLVMEESDVDRARAERPKWHVQVALSTLVLAMLAAVGALFAGITAEASLMNRTEEVIRYSVLEGDRIEVEILKSKHEILISLGETPDQAEVERIQAFEEESAELRNEVELEEGQVFSAQSAHLTLAVAVTILSVGITLCGAAIVVDQRYLWIVGLILGVVGMIVLGSGIVSMIFR